MSSDGYMTGFFFFFFNHLEVSVLRILSLEGLSTVPQLSSDLAKGSPSVETEGGGCCGEGGWGGEGKRMRLSVAWSFTSRYP